MKKKLLPAAGLVLAAAVSQASGQLVYEPFDYGSAAQTGNAANFSNLTGTPAFQGYNDPQSGIAWYATGTAQTAQFTVQAPGSLAAITGLQPASGGIIGGNAKTAEAPRIGIAPTGFTTAGTTVYYSMALNIGDLSNLNSTTGFSGILAGFNNTFGTQPGVPGVVSARLQIRLDGTDPSKYNLGIASNANTPITWAPNQFSTSDTVFVVAGYTINGAGVGGSDDTNSLWINPDPSSFGSGTAPAPTVSQTGPTDITTSVLSFVFRTANVANGTPTAAKYDELRIDTSWAQVTPAYGVGTNGAALNASGGNWSDGSQWDTGAAPNGSNGFAYFTGSGGTVALDSNQTVTDLTFKSSNSYSVTAGGGTLNMVAGSGLSTTINVQATMDPTGPNIALADSHSISAPISLSNNLAVDAAANQTLTISSNIDGGGAKTLTKNGPGTLVLSGSNTFGGATNIVLGKLSVANANAISTGNMNVSNGSTLDIGATNITVGVLTQTTPNIAGIGVSSAGAVLGSGGTITATSYNFAGGTVSANLAGTGALVKQGSAFQATFSGVNTYSGNTSLNNNANISLFTQPASLPNYNTGLGKISVGNSSTTLAASVGGPGQWQSSDIDDLLTTGAGSNVSFAAGARLGFNVDTGNNFTYGSVIGNSSGGNLGITKLGAGVLALTNTGNTYNGGTVVNGGVLALSGTLATLTDHSADSYSGSSELGTAPANNSLVNSGIVLNGGTIRADGDLDIGSHRRIDLGTAGGTIDTNGHLVRLGIGYNGAKSELNNSGGVLGVGSTLTLTGGGTVERSLATGVDNSTGADTFSTLVVTGGTTYKFLNDIQIGATNSTLTLNGGTLVFRPSTLAQNAFLLLGGVTATNTQNRNVFLGAAGGTLDMAGDDYIGGNKSAYINGNPGTPGGFQGSGNLTIMDGSFQPGVNENFRVSGWTGSLTVVTGGTFGAKDEGHLPQPVSFNPAGVTLDGGTLAFTNNSANGANNANLPGTLGFTITSNGGTIDTQSPINSAALNAGITGSAGTTLVKASGGTLILNGNSNNPGVSVYSGNIQMNGGTVSVSADNNLGDGSATNNLGMNGGSLLLTGNLAGSTRKITLGASGGTVDTGGFNGDFGAIDPGPFSKNGLGQMNVTSINATVLAVNNGVLHVRPSGLSTVSTSVLASAPTIGATGQLDLEDNAMIVNYGSETTGATQAAIRSLLINGRGFTGPGIAQWNGAGGITSSYAHANGNGFNLAIGYADNAVLASINTAGSYTAFGGQTVASTTILVRMTRGADANLDGVVDGNDVSIIGTHFNAPGSGQWYFGDFDYSGLCDGNDISVLGTTFGSSSPTLSPAQLSSEFGTAFASAFEAGASGGGAAVPEPASLTLIGLGGLALMGRRRRKHSV